MKTNLSKKRKEKKNNKISEEDKTDSSQKKETKEEKDKLKLYFNSDTQDAIVAYQTELTKKGKDKLYVEKILPAFKKLVENLINIHKFTGMHDTYEELKNDCVNFLFETIHKFDASRGTNAFSYFNVVAKNWLIIKTKQKSQRTKKSVSLDDPQSLTTHESFIIEEHNTVEAQDFFFEPNVTAENTVILLYEIRSRVKTENELTCINAIITIFENIDEIDLLNKSAVLLYMRELSGLSPKQLTTAMQSIKRRYKKSRFDHRDL
jgi:hypothetical protein